MDIIIGKKGLMFTVLSIFLVFIILTAFVIQLQNETDVEIDRNRIEIETMNSFVGSMEDVFLQTAIKKSMTRTLQSLSECIIVNPSPSGDPDKKLLTAVDNRIIEIFIDGKPGGSLKKECTDVIESFMVLPGAQNFSLIGPDEKSGTLKELMDLANSTGIELIIGNNPDKIDILTSDISIVQNDPWNIDVTLTLDYRIENKDKSIIWDRPGTVITTPVSLVGVNDPLIAAHEGKRIAIKKWFGTNANDLDDLIKQGRFINSDLAPNFLQRLDQNWVGTSSPNGIETLRGQPIGEGTWVDYLLYQTTITPGSPCSNYNGVLRIRLDNPHKSLYKC